jgi:hypothetical protein
MSLDFVHWRILKHNLNLPKAKYLRTWINLSTFFCWAVRHWTMVVSLLCYIQNCVRDHFYFWRHRDTVATNQVISYASFYTKPSTITFHPPSLPLIITYTNGYGIYCEEFRLTLLLVLCGMKQLAIKITIKKLLKTLQFVVYTVHW